MFRPPRMLPAPPTAVAAGASHAEPSAAHLVRFMTTPLLPCTRAVIRRAFASRVLRSPAAVFYAYSTADVAAAVKCAHAWGVQISPAGGRQGFQGGAIQDGFLVVDVSNMTQVRLLTFTILPGRGPSRTRREDVRWIHSSLLALHFVGRTHAAASHRARRPRGGP